MNSTVRNFLAYRPVPWESDPSHDPYPPDVTAAAAEYDEATNEYTPDIREFWGRLVGAVTDHRPDVAESMLEFTRLSDDYSGFANGNDMGVYDGLPHILAEFARVVPRRVRDGERVTLTPVRFAAALVRAAVASGLTLGPVRVCRRTDEPPDSPPWSVVYVHLPSLAGFEPQFAGLFSLLCAAVTDFNGEVKVVPIPYEPLPPARWWLPALGMDEIPF